MGIYIDFLESSKGVTSNTICGECFRKDWIEEWIAWLKEVRKCSPQTCNHRLSILKNFLRFLAHKKIQFIKYDCDAAEIKRMQQPKKTSGSNHKRYNQTDFCKHQYTDIDR